MQTDDGSGGTTTYMSLKGNEQLIRFLKSTRHNDGVIAQFGSSNDLRIQHDGSNSWIYNDTGNLYIENRVDDGDLIFRGDNGSGGLTNYFYLDGSAERVIYDKPARFFDDIFFPDSSIAYFGDGNDLRIQHNGSHSFIQQYGTGNLYIDQTIDDGDIVFRSDDGSGGLKTYFFLDGSAGNLNFQNNALVALGGIYGNGGSITLYNDTYNFKSATSTDLMKLTTTGLGIGTTSPTEELDIAGSLKVRGDSSAATEVLELGQFVSPNVTPPFIRRMKRKVFRGFFGR